MKRCAEILLGAVFVFSAGTKLLNLQLFFFQVQQYHILPTGWEVPLGLWLVWLELLTGLGLLCKIFLCPALLLSAGMYLLFTAFVATALVRGSEADCGCFGTISGPVSPFHLLMVAGGSLLSLSLFVYRRTTLPEDGLR